MTWYKTEEGLAARQLVDPITFNVPHTEPETYTQPSTTPATIEVKVVERQNKRTEYAGGEPLDVSAHHARSIDGEAELARRTELIRRDPYKTVCNDGNIKAGDQSYCQAWFRTFGGNNDRCGATRLCQWGDVRISGSLWESTDKNYMTKCSHVSNAIEEVWKTCGTRGGKLSCVLILFD